MDLSVIIPTYRRPEKLAACLRALRDQSLDSRRYEVLVGFDGADPESEAAAKVAWNAPPAAAGVTEAVVGGSDARGGCGGGGWDHGGSGGATRAALMLRTCERSGLNAVRNALLREARGRFIVSLNDDVSPCRTFLETHLREQSAAESRGRAAVISGFSPWKMPADPTLFDRLVAESSMIFFFDQMTPEKVAAAGPMHDWGFRHCYGLNFSAPTAMIRDTGGFVAFPLAYGYDDIEIAHRLRQRFDAPTLYRPEAVAEHDHRYAPIEVLTREFRLGHCAWHFAGHAPAFCREVFRRDVRTAEELGYSRSYLSRERTTAAMVKETFVRLAETPASAAGGDHSRDLIRMIYLHHLPLKRWMWRAGLVAAAEERPNDRVEWPE